VDATSGYPLAPGEEFTDEYAFHWLYAITDPSQSGEVAVFIVWR
jgi:hypothetical protein